MTTADYVFQILVYVALPAAVAYPVIYLTLARGWWVSWIGRALLIKAVGVAILLSTSALYQFFGPDYFARDAIRITGMALVATGTWLALVAMLHELLKPTPRKP